MGETKDFDSKTFLLRPDQSCEDGNNGEKSEKSIGWGVGVVRLGGHLSQFETLKTCTYTLKEER